MFLWAAAAAVIIPLGLDLYLPAPDDNPVTTEKIQTGRQLFFDRRLSRDGLVSCASCHNPEKAFSDGRRTAIGVFGRLGRRNAPALVNRGYGQSFFWDGRSRTLEEQVLLPIQDRNEMDMTLAEASARVGLPVGEISHALATFVRTLLSGDSPFDRFLNGEREALTEEQQVGMGLFRGKANCATCHAGPNFTDEQLHNTGVAWKVDRLSDEGAGQGRFKTPNLREVSQSAPYMHDGNLETLEDVIEYYDRGGNRNPHLDSQIKPLHLTSSDKKALVEFLRTLGRVLNR